MIVFYRGLLVRVASLINSVALPLKHAECYFIASVLVANRLLEKVVSIWDARLNLLHCKADYILCLGHDSCDAKHAVLAQWTHLRDPSVGLDSPLAENLRELR